MTFNIVKKEQIASPLINNNFIEKVSYKGHLYEFIEIRERMFSSRERIGRAFLGVLAVILTLFLALFSKSIRDLFTEKKKIIKDIVLINSKEIEEKISREDFSDLSDLHSIKDTSTPKILSLNKEECIEDIFHRFLKNVKVSTIDNFSVLSWKDSTITKNTLTFVASSFKSSCEQVLKEHRMHCECGEDAESLIDKLTEQLPGSCIKKLILYKGVGLQEYDKQSYWIPHGTKESGFYFSPVDDSYHGLVYTEIFHKNKKKLFVAIDVNLSRRVKLNDGVINNGQLFIDDSQQGLIKLLNGRYGKHEIYTMNKKTFWTEIFAKDRSIDIEEL